MMHVCGAMHLRQVAEQPGRPGPRDVAQPPSGWKIIAVQKHLRA